MTKSAVATVKKLGIKEVIKLEFVLFSEAKYINHPGPRPAFDFRPKGYAMPTYVRGSEEGNIISGSF
ncbi:MAG: hypothetical protein IH795_10240, partial [Bacteroidetes bacterium]|nr:hypothetical protein [Bacteroidota bacterium]